MRRMALGLLCILTRRPGANWRTLMPTNSSASILPISSHARQRVSVSTGHTAPRSEIAHSDAVNSCQSAVRRVETSTFQLSICPAFPHPTQRRRGRT